MGGKRDSISDSHGGSNQVRSWSQVKVGSQVLNGVELLGKRVSSGVEVATENLHTVVLWVVTKDFDELSFSWGLNNLSLNFPTGRDLLLLDFSEVRHAFLDNDLSKLNSIRQELTLPGRSGEWIRL